MSFLDLFPAYEEAWKSMLAPERCEYSIDDLGPHKFLAKNIVVKRTDLSLKNKRGFNVECSYFEQESSETKLPCVVYLHASGSSRLEALQYKELIAINGMNMFCFDFTACGKSGGLYSSVGWYEQDDLHTVLDYLTKVAEIERIGLWGRSMGAVTAILGTQIDTRASCLILDSPFSNLEKLISDIVKSKTIIPGFLGSTVASLMSETVKEKANFEIKKINPVKAVTKSRLPAFFGTSHQDTYIPSTHTRELYDAYGGPKEIFYFEGDHNSKRPPKWMQNCVKFLKQHLIDSNYSKIHDKKIFYNNNIPRAFGENSDKPFKEINLNQREKIIKYDSEKKKNVPNMNFSWLEHSPSASNLEAKWNRQTQSETKPATYSKENQEKSKILTENVIGFPDLPETRSRSDSNNISAESKSNPIQHTRNPSDFRTYFDHKTKVRQINLNDDRDKSPMRTDTGLSAREETVNGRKVRRVEIKLDMNIHETKVEEPSVVQKLFSMSNGAIRNRDETQSKSPLRNNVVPGRTDSSTPNRYYRQNSDNTRVASIFGKKGSSPNIYSTTQQSTTSALKTQKSQLLFSQTNFILAPETNEGQLHYKELYEKVSRQITNSPEFRNKYDSNPYLDSSQIVDTRNYVSQEYPQENLLTQQNSVIYNTFDASPKTLNVRH